MRSLALEHLVADLSFGILDQQTSLGALEEDDRPHNDQRQRQEENEDAGRDRPRARELKELYQRTGQARDDARENDQRRAVADAALRHLLAEPHQEDGTADQRDDGRARKNMPGSMTTAPAVLCDPSRPTAIP